MYFIAVIRLWTEELLAISWNRETMAIIYIRTLVGCALTTETRLS